MILLFSTRFYLFNQFYYIYLFILHFNHVLEDEVLIFVQS